MEDAILSGVRVLDFGRYIAGPLCAALLGDLGAEVIRIEQPGGGDDRSVYPVTKAGDGAVFLQCNRNKRAMTLDLKTPAGAAVLHRLVSNSDVVVANIPSAILKSMGLSYEQLTAIRPDIILVAVSAFGARGPDADKVGFDGVGQAMSGAPYLTGFDRPTKSFSSWVDVTTALLAAYGALAAIHERSRTGKGQEVQTSLLAGALTVMNFPLIEQDLAQVNRERTGNRGQSGAPTDFFETSDGWIVVQVIGDAIFRRWAQLMGEEHWLSDPRFASDALRSHNGVVLSERTAKWCRELSTAEALMHLAGARIPSGPVLSPQQALDHPQVQHSGIMQPMPFPGAVKPPLLALHALELSRTPPKLWRRAPTAGEHTVEILAELGFSDEEVAALTQASTI